MNLNVMSFRCRGRNLSRSAAESAGNVSMDFSIMSWSVHANVVTVEGICCHELFATNGVNLIWWRRLEVVPVVSSYGATESSWRPNKRFHAHQWHHPSRSSRRGRIARLSISLVFNFFSFFYYSTLTHGLNSDELIRSWKAPCWPSMPD